MQQATRDYNTQKSAKYRKICDLLAQEIDKALPHAENKIWHAHPVWFLNGNPIVGYSEPKSGIRLMFWSGADFGEPGLNVPGKKFKDASVYYTDAAQVSTVDLRRWLRTAQTIQWDYKNIVRRKGRLVRIKPETDN